MPDDAIVIEITGHVMRPEVFKPEDRVIFDTDGLWLLRKLPFNPGAMLGIIADGEADFIDPCPSDAMQRLASASRPSLLRAGPASPHETRAQTSG